MVENPIAPVGARAHGGHVNLSLTPVSLVTEKAIRLWNDLLESRSDGALEVRDRITEGIRREGLLYGDRSLITFLRPRFMDEAEWRQARTMAAAFHASLTRMMRRFMHDPEMLEDLGVRGRVQELVRMSTDEDDTLWFVRWDGFSHGGTIRLVEFNSDSPGGAAFVDVFASVFESLPIFREFSGRVKLARRDSFSAMVRCVRLASEKIRASLTSAGPRVALVDWADVNTSREFTLIQEEFARHGIDAVVADPRQVDIVGDRMVIHGKPIDILIKRVLVTDLAQRWDEAKNLIEALRRRLVVSMNPLACQAVTVKSLLAFFHEGRLDRYLTPTARRFWERHIPWTVRVQEGRVPWRGQEMDTLALLVRERERLVLKPSDAWGAEGIVLGWRCPAHEWEDHLQNALQVGDYVAQERVEIPVEEYPEADDGILHYRRLRVEISPYSFHRRTVTECLCRLSESDFLNIKAGGGMVPSYVIRDGSFA